MSVDDFFFYYLQTGNVSVNVCQSNGIEFAILGTCKLDLQSVVTGSSSKILSDIYSADNKVIGTLEYVISVAIPIPLSIKAYHERTVALNLSDPEIPKTISKSRGTMNNLHITLSKGLFNRGSGGAKIYGVVQFDPAGHGIITTMIDDYRGDFAWEYVIPLNITTTLDRHLRTSKLLICFVDVEKEFVYGYCKIPSLDLALGLSIKADFS